MIDTATINAQIDLQAVAESAGAIFRGKRANCPIHGGDNKTAFELFDNGRAWTCHTHGAECNKFGHDGIGLLRALNNWTFNEVKEKYSAPLEPQEAAKRAAQTAERITRELQETIERAQKALEELQKARKWLEYHNNMSTANRAMWNARGIPDEWQDFWKFGYCQSCPTYKQSPSLTLPIYTPNQDDPLLIRHRLLKPDPTNPKDKYRPEVSGLPSAVFYGDTTLPIEAADRVIVVEGEIKGAVTFLTVDRPLWQVIGIPGRDAFKAAEKILQGHDAIWMIPDPGVESDWREKAAHLKARFITLPEKIDDMILAGTLGRAEIVGMMEQARRN